MYQPPAASTMVFDSAVSLCSNYPFVVSSFDSEGDESDDELFDFSIIRELLIDPNDVMTGEMIGEGGYSIVYKGLCVSSLSY